MRNRLIKGSIWAVLSRIIGISLSLVFNIVLARMLEPKEMGEYFIILSLISIFSIFAQMGLSLAVVKLIAETVAIGALGRTKQIIKQAIFLAFIGGIVIGLVFYFGLGDLVLSRGFHITSLDSTIGLIAILIIVNCMQTLLGEIYRGFHDIRMASIIASIIPQINLLGVLILWWLNRDHFDVQQILWVTLISALMALFFTVGFINKKVAKLHGLENCMYQDIISVAWPLYFFQIGIFIATQADIWVVGALLSEQDVAIYGVIQKVSIIMTITHSLIVTVAQSSVAELYATGEKSKLEKIIQGMAFVAFIPTGILFFILVFFGENLLSFLFGDFYRVGIIPLLILSAGHFLAKLLGPAGMVLMMTGYQKQSMYIILTTGLANIALAFFLAKPFGLIGIALAWSAGSVLYAICGWLFVYKKLNVRTHVICLPEMKFWRLNR